MVKSVLCAHSDNALLLWVDLNPSWCFGVVVFFGRFQAFLQT